MAARKNSKKRQAILDALTATTEHPSAERLYQTLKEDYPDLSLGTVYRNLSLFADEGEALRLNGFGGQERFDGRTDPHAHLLCSVCGRVLDVELPGLDARLRALAGEASGAEVTGCALSFTGVCADCRKPDGSSSDFK